MPDENQPEQPFVKKTIETPILDSDLRNQITEQQEPGFKGFYNANKIYFWAILVGLLVIAVLAYFVFRKIPQAQPKEARVEMAIQVDPDNTVPSGSTGVYRFLIKNNEDQKLTNIQLELSYPEGVSFSNSSPVQPSNLSGTVFNLADLPPNGSVTVIELVNAKFNGNVNDQKTLTAKLHYKYANFNLGYTKEFTNTVRLVASNVLLNLSGPDSTNNAQLVSYTINYQNNSSNDIKNARIKMTYPEGFNFAQSQPSPDLSNDTWNVDTLPKNASSTITIQGTFASAHPGESKNLKAEFLILGEGSFFVQNSATVSTAISSLPLLVTQEIRDTQANGVVDPGETLNFNISYQNNGTTAANGVNIQVDLDSKALDLSSIRAEGGQVNNNSITWNASGVPKLLVLAPNQGGQLTFSVKVNNPAVKDSSKNLTVVSNIQIKSNEYSTPFPGSKLNLKISSPASISSSLSFVSGQLPPQVGKSTTYKVSLMLANSSNDYAGGNVTAFVPLGSGGFDINSVNQSEKQNVQYDASTGKLTWNFGGLLAGTGKFSQAKTLSFNVTLNPSASQANQSVTLVKDINFSAVDVFTQKETKLTSKNISTFDVQGQNGWGSGTVQP